LADSLRFNPHVVELWVLAAQWWGVKVWTLMIWWMWL